MRLREIKTIEEANAFLPQFLEEINLRFGKEAVNPEDAHRALRVQDDLTKIFFRKELRKLSKDLTFQHLRNFYMIQTKTPNRLRHATVEVLVHRDKTIEVPYKGENLLVSGLDAGKASKECTLFSAEESVSILR